MSDLLTQDQINELLNQNSPGGVDLPMDMGSAQAAGRNFDALSMALAVLFDQAKAVLLTVMSKSIEFAIDTCAKADQSAVNEKMGEESLCITIPLSGGLSGNLRAIMRKKDVALFSDLMMMGDGSAEYSEEHNDAIGELWSQIMGAYTSSMGARLGSSVSAGGVSVSAWDDSTAGSTCEGTDMALVTMDVAEIGQSPLGIILDDDLSGQLAKSMAAETGTDGPALADSGFDSLSTSSYGSAPSSYGESGSNGSGFSQSLSKLPRENVDLLMDIDLDIVIELGTAHLSIKKILELAPGSIVELDRLAGEPVDLLVNNKVVAKGEVVVVDENFGIRIVSLVSAEDRIKSLR